MTYISNYNFVIHCSTGLLSFPLTDAVEEPFSKSKPHPNILTVYNVC